MAAEKNETFAKRLQRLRERKGISRAVLSELCGLSRNQVARYEHGERKPTPDALIAMADYFGVSVDYLLCREEKEN